MQFASPAVLWGVLAAAAGVVVLHLLSWRRPQPRWLPTARFLPVAPQRAVSRRVEPSDLGLLALRLLALVALGLAVAGPGFPLRRSGVARVIVADRSRAVASPAEVRDSVTRLETGAAAVRVILFDSLPVAASDNAWRDSSGSTKRGNLDAALVAAVREATALRAQFDSVELVVVSPLHAEEVSAGTGRILGSFSGQPRLVRVTSRAMELPPALASRDWPPATDPVGAALRLASGSLPSWLRVARSPLTTTDSAHAANGGLVLLWLPGGDDTLTADGVLSHSGSVVGQFARQAPPAGTPVAWWSDGQPAAAQQASGAGCIRQVAITVPRSGDAALRPAFQRLIRDLTVRCDWRDDRVIASLSRSGAAPSGAHTGVRDAAGTSSLLTRRLLLVLALIALAAEWWLRGRRGRGTAASSLTLSGHTS